MSTNKEFDNVKVNMTLHEQQTRANLLSTSEDLADQMGKIQKWYQDFRPEVFDGTSRNDLIVKSKTFTDVIGSSNDSNGAVFYFGYVRPTTYDDTAFIRFRILVYVPGQVNYRAYADVTYTITRASLSYNIINNMVNTSYRPVYYHYIGRLTSAGFNASTNYGNIIGIGMQSSANPTSASYKRTIVLEILEEQGCEFTFYDTALKPANVPGYSSTNFSVSTIAFTGNQTLPDNNTYSQTYVNERLKAGPNGVKQYSLCAINKDDMMESLTTTHGTGTKSFYTTGKFRYKPNIYYYSGSSNVASGSAIGSDAEYPIITTIDSRYSATGITDTVGWTMYKPIYWEVTFDENRHWSVTENGLTQTLREGYYYIYIGMPRNTYQISLTEMHPVFYYDGTNLIDADKKFLDDAAAAVPGPTTCSISEGTLTFTLN